MASRSEEEIYKLILDTAEADERVRFVVLEGSRANPHAKKDPFQDFDIIYGVFDIKPFVNNINWIEKFGERMVMQQPDDMFGEKASNYKYTYLMQFVDGNRIDLNILAINQLKNYKFNSCSKVLLDKDGILSLPPSNDSDYLPAAPTAKEFYDCCNEFWWCVPYVAKGLWRKELFYARDILDGTLREQTMTLMNWYFGIKTDFKRAPGKCGKNYANFIEQELLDLLSGCYRSDSIENTWKALASNCQLIARIGKVIADKFQFEYPIEDQEKVLIHIERVKTLSQVP